MNFLFKVFYKLIFINFFIQKKEHHKNYFIFKKGEMNGQETNDVLTKKN